MPYEIWCSCPKCGLRAEGLDEIKKLFGFRKINDKRPIMIIINFSIYFNKEFKLNKNKKNKDLNKLNFINLL